MWTDFFLSVQEQQTKSFDDCFECWVLYCGLLQSDFEQEFLKNEKVTHTPADCATWLVERHICSWSPWHGTSSCTTTTLSSVHACIFCHCQLCSVRILNTDISQGSVVAHLRHSGICNDHFIANFLGGVPVKEFWKWSILAGDMHSVSLFDSQYRCYHSADTVILYPAINE